MPSVCFTGIGYLPTGQHLGRAQWEIRAQNQRWTVHDKVERHTTYLVASRTDTTKARAAARNGVTVITYAEFEALLDGYTLSGVRGRRITVDPENPPMPSTDNYQIGFWRGDFTAMHGEVCLIRSVLLETAERAITVHAERAGVTAHVTYTPGATREMTRLRAVQQARAASPPPPVRSLAADIEAVTRAGMEIVRQPEPEKPKSTFVAQGKRAINWGDDE